MLNRPTGQSKQSLKEERQQDLARLKRNGGKTLVEVNIIDSKFNYAGSLEAQVGMVLYGGQKIIKVNPLSIVTEATSELGNVFKSTINIKDTQDITVEEAQKWGYISR